MGTAEMCRTGRHFAAEYGDGDWSHCCCCCSTLLVTLLLNTARSCWLTRDGLAAELLIMKKTSANRVKNEDLESKSKRTWRESGTVEEHGSMVDL
jgi:hypothetical protein